VNERMKEKGEKDKRGGSNKDMRGMIKWKKRKIKCKEGCHVRWEFYKIDLG
jgi:hypothetical protein